MKRAFFLTSFLLLIHSASFGQSYVDSGIQHYIKEEYREALVDFDQARELKALLTESALGKMHYYVGMTWLGMAESGKSVKDQDALVESYLNLKVVSSFSEEWTEPVSKAYGRLSTLLIDRVDDLLKDYRKADGLDASLIILDEIIFCWGMVDEMEVTYGSSLELALANKAAGDLIFENAKDFEGMNRAKEYYETALPLYEEARYDDPFSKDIISDLLILAQRLADQERIEEYEKLLKLAGG